MADVFFVSVGPHGTSYLYWWINFPLLITPQNEYHIKKYMWQRESQQNN